MSKEHVSPLPLTLSQLGFTVVLFDSQLIAHMASLSYSFSALLVHLDCDQFDGSAPCIVELSVLATHCQHGIVVI